MKPRMEIRVKARRGHEIRAYYGGVLSEAFEKCERLGEVVKPREVADEAVDRKPSQARPASA